MLLRQVRLQLVLLQAWLPLLELVQKLFRPFDSQEARRQTSPNRYIGALKDRATNL